MQISCVIPTIGRDTLRAAVESCTDADEVIVVVDRGADGQGPGADAALHLPDAPTVRLAVVDGGDNGYTARTRGMRMARGTHLCFLDDDDAYVDGAFDVMREAACDVPVIFRMRHYKQGVLWTSRQLRFGNVGTPMLLIPNRPADLGEWRAHAPAFREAGGDYTFAAGCVERMGGPVWREEIVAVVRPHVRQRVMA